MPTRLHVLVKFLDLKEGGRDRLPRLKGYPPHLVVPPDSTRLGVLFTDGPERFKAGEEVSAHVLCLHEPEVSYASLTTGAHFEILEGSHLVGQGVVLAN